MTNIKLIIGAVIGVVILSLAAAVYFYRTEVKTVKVDLAACQSANDESTQTIAKMKDEIKNAYALSDKRMQVKETLVRRLQEIDSITVPGEKDEKSDAVAGGDPLLDELNRMFSSGRKDGVR